MAFNSEQPTNTSISTISPPELTDDQFYAVVDRLKAQKSLPRDSFIKDMPFFTFSTVSKESQVRELFQDVSDPKPLQVSPQELS